jgi:hypothetical protein
MSVALTGPATALVRRIASGDLSATQVIDAHLDRIGCRGAR